MFKKKLFALGFLVVAILFLISSVSFADELGDIQKAIKEKSAKWVAGRTSMMLLTPEERRIRLGLIQARGMADEEASPYQESFAAVPASFDWRNIDGNGMSYVTPIRNQSSCGSCWAFAATAGLESYILMTQNNPNANLDLAEQILTSCYNTDGCSGGSPSGASNYIKTTGLPLESCFPYKATDANDPPDPVTCDEACANWQQNTYKILNYGSVTKSVSAIKDALVNYGPLVTTFDVYADFFGYNGGIYSYTSGTYQGGHAVLIVGYDDANSCFIVKNSWGTAWGEAGYFRIDYSQLASPIYFGRGTLTYYGSLSAPSITVTSPSISSSWQAGTTQTISWTFAGYPGASLKVDLLKNGALNRNITNSTSLGLNGNGSYNWTIPSDLYAGSDYQVVVTSTSNASINDMSDNFSITVPLPSITATTPNGGENWEAGKSYTIRWNYTGSAETTVKIELFKNGIFDSYITTSTSIGNSGSGSYPWTIPSTQTPGNDYRISVTSTTNSSYVDTSNNNFTISSPPPPPSITVEVPNSRESWKTGTTQKLQWAYTGNPGSQVKIELLSNDSLYKTLSRKASIGSNGKGSYNWRISTKEKTGLYYKIKVTSLTNSLYTDSSDVNFEIYK